jgi:flagellin-specific chaperone FliS
MRWNGLGAGLNREVNPEIVDQMTALYSFVHRRLIEANVNSDLKAADEALFILRHQRETWEVLTSKVLEVRSSVSAPKAHILPQVAPQIEEPAVSRFIAEG